MCHIIIQHIWISSEYFMNIIRICWKCKTCVISLYNIFEYYPNIFWILFLYVESTKQCHIHYSIFSESYMNIFWILFVYDEHAKHMWYSLFSYIHSWILSVYFRNLIRICWKCKTCVIFIIQHFWILLEYVLNLIRIFSEFYSYMMNMQNRCDIHYSVIYIFEYYLYIFGILFVYIENAK